MSAGPILLLPGIWLPQATLLVLARRLKAVGFPIRLFRYGTLREASERVMARLAALWQGPEPPQAIVGHSLGGLLAVAAMAAHGFAVPRLVCLGSPLRGSAVARALARSPLTRASLGRHGQLLTRGLAQAPPDSAIGVVAGSLPVGIGVFLPGLAAPHDGVVSVAETALPGIRDHLVLRLNHSGLLISPLAAEAVSVFLREGSFASLRRSRGLAEPSAPP